MNAELSDFQKKTKAQTIIDNLNLEKDLKNLEGIGRCRNYG